MMKSDTLNEIADKVSGNSYFSLRCLSLTLLFIKYKTY